MLRGKVKQPPLVSMRQSTRSLAQFNAAGATARILFLVPHLELIRAQRFPAETSPSDFFHSEARLFTLYLCFAYLQQLPPLSPSLGLKPFEGLSGLARNLERVHLSKGSSAPAANQTRTSASSASVYTATSSNAPAHNASSLNASSLNASSLNASAPNASAPNAFGPNASAPNASASQTSARAPSSSSKRDKRGKSDKRGRAEVCSRS
uniref:Uncharacterized protein n=1 Tax=Mycena chlorophos TaxID=658473 RepID=A0ABQ0KYC8_MYCCL|nr:predicted protein [Mycena chlorophos]